MAGVYNLDRLIVHGERLYNENTTTNFSKQLK